MTIHTKPVHLPTIDFSRFYGSAEERAGFIRELTRVLHDHGFFYLTGHGVPQSLISAATTGRAMSEPAASRTGASSSTSTRRAQRSRPGQRRRGTAFMGRTSGRRPCRS
jgi:hypothetical protein